MKVKKKKMTFWPSRPDTCAAHPPPKLKTKEVKVEPMSPGLLESAEQLLVEDLYNRVKEKIDDRSLFNTPCVLDLQRELLKDHMESPLNEVDEVWPNVFIAEKSVAVNKGRLKRMGITHILNAGHNTTVFTGPNFYTGMEIQYMGVEVDDFPDCDISKFFRPAAEFLDEALLTYRGKVLVNSEMGMSRSSVLVAAYLMIFHHMTILEALMTLRKKRAIYPNDGFIMQLRELNEKLLEEREYSDGLDDGDTNSQGSVVEAKTHSIVVEEEDGESIMGAKVHSITFEEEDTTSIMGSAMSMAGKSSVVSKQPTLIDEDEEEKIYEEWRRKQGLPPREIPKKENEQIMKLPEEGDVSDDDLRQMIYNWQKENAKYHSVDPGDDGSSMMSERCYTPSEISDVESVTSQEIRMLKQQFEASRRNRMARGRSDSESTESTWDMWNQRLMEIEKEAVSKSDEKDKKKEKDIDEESLCSEASSLFNFCKKNKHKLTPLERWKIKRIQFGFHKKDSEASDGQTKEENGEKKDEDQMSQSDVNISAYQAWKMKHQKKVGNENKDEIVELAKGEDTASIKRKQRRAEILERSKQTLEESQSMCGWDTESSISGTIPLSALFQTAPSSGSGDAASVLSMQSNRSHQSQARSTVSQAQVPTTVNLPPGADAISIAGIQNWIANVVNETIAQKQNEIMMMSRASSAMSMASGDLGRRADDDRSSILSAAIGSSLSGTAFQQRDHKSSDSVLSYNTSTGSATNIPSTKRKITQTSVPLFGLYMDDVDLKKLNQKENEIREELTEKLTQYRKEKVVSDNKRSYMYRKKKAKGTEEDDEDEEKESVLSSKFQSSRLSSNQEWKKSEKTSYLGNLSHFSGANSTSSDVETNVSKWLSGVNVERASSSYSERSYEKSKRSEHEQEINSQINGHSRKPSEQDKEDYTSHQSYRDSTRATSRFSMSSEEEYDVRRTKVYESQSPEPYLSNRVREHNGLEDVDVPNTRPPRRSHLTDHEDSDVSNRMDLGSTRGRFKNDEDEKKDTLESDSSGERWSRNRKTKEETEEMDDDDIIAAWRSRQEEMKARIRRCKEED
ncbi:serine/threonine/tyrosine-interacting-like protein 2 isoform X2 [Hyla sarda]|uniref:serine/threonine/tyrosine-interacting-like protein 2 isoform X2 n=1 Tax=Hyla sarda TaxID=327740 RepID=UPI0024C45633|nr:serine/threonine/tyrosine-interacting-like protein 2 isoform X2 [Hyla sarda]XP_056415863.1 serine/threonine/tyrosine-interacting-like protein 2 isoform X2 [Hyla sarda]